MTISFTELAMLETRDAIMLVRGEKQNGMRIYAYMRMTREQLKSFRRAVAQRKPVDFDRFGEIMLSGEGEPGSEMHEGMQHKFASGT